MNELVVIAEGETEQTFVRDQLAGHLVMHNISAWAVLPGRHRRHGGVKKWKVARQDIIRTLKERRYCSTMVDYYAMPDDWPGRSDSKSLQWNERAAHVEQQIAIDITESLGDSFNSNFFIPYVQLHEFEALAFADIQQLVSVVLPISDLSQEFLNSQFSQIVENAGHPEAINDSYETCPSRRITKIVPAYRKRLHGSIVTKRIGLSVLCEKCNHFASWIDRLEKIGAE